MKAALPTVAREIVRGHHDAFMVEMMGATSSGLTADRVAALTASGFLHSALAGGWRIDGSRFGLDPWGLAILAGTMLAMASAFRQEQMRDWDLEDWVDAADREIEARIREQADRHAATPEPVRPVEATPEPLPELAPPAPAEPPQLPPPPTGLPVPRRQPTTIDVERVTPPEAAAPVEPQAAPRDTAGGVEPPGTPPPRGNFPTPPTPPPPPTPPSGRVGLPIPAPPAWMGETEREAWIQARTRAGEFARGLGNVAAEDVDDAVRETWAGEQIVVEVQPGKRQERLQIIREQTAKAIEEGWTPDRLASAFGELTGDWAHNWKRIARTELRGAASEATVIAAIRNEGPEARIARIPEPGACPSCLRLFLDGNGRPRIFTAAELVENGTNVGRKEDDWRATVWPVHPNCRCSTEEVPPGFDFDDEWQLVST